MAMEYKKLSLYIEENYVGHSWWGAYHFDSAIPLLEKAKALVNQEEEQKKRTTIEALGRDRDFETIFSVFNFEAQTCFEQEAERDFQTAFDVLSQCEQQENPRHTYDRIERFVTLKSRSETFTSHMLNMISEKGISEAEVYNNVFMDRKLFNKIRNDPEYHPSKRTAILIAISLKLTYEETQALLETAGYTLTHSNKRDLIVEFFIRERNYNIFEINEVLAHFKQPLLMKSD